MSTVQAKPMDLTAPPVVTTIQMRSLIVGVVASLLAAFLAFTRPEEFFRAYLLGFMACIGLTLGSMAVLMLRHLTGGGWGMVIRRILGAAMRTLPVSAAFFVPLIFGMRYLYVWARPIEPTVANKHLLEISQSYLNPKFFILRAVIYFAIWGLIAFLLTKWSREQDHPPVRDNSTRFQALGGPGLILYGFTISFAAIDWVMSIDPSWISTIYGLLFLAGQVLSAICFAVVVERILFRYRPMSELLKPKHVHDHGNLMLTFVMVWAYFSFSQWLIIWAGNLPDEISWYLKRLNGGWSHLGLFLVAFHFAVPFVLLLSRPFKRDVTRLVWLAVWLLFMRYVDLLWLIEPNFSARFAVTLADVVVPVAMVGLWLAYFFRNLGSIPLLPAYDVFAKDVLEPAHE